VRFTAVVQDRVTELLDLEEIVRSVDPADAAGAATAGG
jgi:hypothetical protein